MSDRLTASCPDGRVLVVGARGAHKRGVRAAAYSSDASGAFALASAVVFAKCAALADADADVQRATRLAALDCVADERGRVRAVLLHFEAARADRVVAVLGHFDLSLSASSSSPSSSLVYGALAHALLPAADEFGSDKLRFGFVPGTRVPTVVAMTTVPSLYVAVWDAASGAIVRLDLPPARLVPHWPALCVARNCDTGELDPVLVFAAEHAGVPGASLPLQSAFLAGIDAATAVHLAERDADASHSWLRVQVRPGGLLRTDAGWPGVLPCSAAELARAVSLDEHAQRAWIVTANGALLYCSGGLLVRSFAVATPWQAVQLVPIELADELGASVAVFDASGGRVLVCDAASDEVHAVAESGVVAALRLASGALLLERRSEAALSATTTVARRVRAHVIDGTEQTSAVMASVAKALAARIELVRGALERNSALLTAKQSLLRSRLAMLHGRPADALALTALNVTALLGPPATSDAPSMQTDDEALVVSVVDASFQLADALLGRAMRAACVVRLRAADARIVLGDLSLSVVVRDCALRAVSYCEPVLHRAAVPQVAALARGAFAVTDASDLRVACEVEPPSAVTTEHAVLLLRWQWFVLTDDGRIEPHAGNGAATHQFVSLRPPLCRSASGDIAFRPVAKTLIVLASCELERLTRCVVSTLGAERDGDAFASDAVRVRILQRAGSGGDSGAQLHLRCASAAAAASAVARLRTVLGAEFSADVVDVNSDGTAERLACMALAHECSVLRGFVEAARTGRPVDLARVSEAAVASDVAVKQCIQ